MTPHTLDFDAADGGKNADYLLRWVNPTGQKGPWSETATVTGMMPRRQRPTAFDDRLVGYICDERIGHVNNTGFHSRITQREVI